MGQILNRFKRYVESEINNKSNSNGLVDNVAFDEEDELKKTIDELNNSKQKSNHDSKKSRQSDDIRMNPTLAYSILGVTPEDSLDIIRESYKKKIKEYHPDKVESMGQEIKDLAARKTIEINEAYALLKKMRNL